MVYSKLIPSEVLADHITDSHWAIFDCRFSLTDPELGQKQYLESHIPGALYAHLDRDLSGPVVPGKTGRHPLPSQAVVERRFSEWGIDPQTQVVVYDDSGGSIAARLWWMLHWQGHEATAVLDGGWQGWLGGGFSTKARSETRPAARFSARPRPEMVATREEVEARTKGSEMVLIDSRSPERHRGENETIDPLAGHIPGSLNFFYGQTLDERGFYLPPERLRILLQGALKGGSARDAVFYCGSGVSAGQNLLAMAVAGLEGARLYPGSWSEWITDPSRPIQTNAENAVMRKDP